MTSILDASLITAIKTPFNNNGDIDLDTYDQLIKQQISAGVDGIIVGGTTGEGHLLSWEEHLMLIAHCINKFSDKLLIIGNTYKYLGNVLQNENVNDANLYYFELSANQYLANQNKIK